MEEIGSYSFFEIGTIKVRKDNEKYDVFYETVEGNKQIAFDCNKGEIETKVLQYLSSEKLKFLGKIENLEMLSETILMKGLNEESSERYNKFFMEKSNRS